ncbi:Predicted AAA-ATPase, partial [Lachnospiraceae bacterium XBB1006]
LIQDIVKKGGKVTLFTRPRRFGKTLALSMLRTFFELEYDRDGNVM